MLLRDVRLGEVVGLAIGADPHPKKPDTGQMLLRDPGSETDWCENPGWSDLQGGFDRHPSA